MALFKDYLTEVIPPTPGDPGQVGYTSCPPPPPPPPPPPGGGGGGGNGPPSSGGGGGGGPMGCPEGTTYTCTIVHLPYPVEFCYCNTA